MDLAIDAETMASVPFSRLRRRGGGMADPEDAAAWAGINVATVAWAPVSRADGAVGAPTTAAVRPRPWEVVDNPFSPEVTREALLATGEPAAVALGRFAEAALAADRLVSHNAAFDRGLLLAHMRREGLGGLADRLAAREWLCTMRRAVEAGPPGRKFPKLGELMEQHGLAWPAGEPHCAGVDAVACGLCHAAQMAERGELLGVPMSPVSEAEAEAEAEDDDDVYVHGDEGPPPAADSVEAMGQPE